MNNLIERLKLTIAECHAQGVKQIGMSLEDAEEAVSRVESLSAQVAELTDELAIEKRAVERWTNNAAGYAQKLDAAEAQVAELKKDAERSMNALRELVELKNLKDRDVVFDGDAYADYARRKPLAWEVARAIIAAKESGVSP